MTTRTAAVDAGTPAAPVATGRLDLTAAATRPVADVLAALGSGPDGLGDAEARRRRHEHGPNAVREHRARAGAVLVRQLRSPLLVLLALTAAVSFFLGERTDALVIGTILALSVGLSFVNEYRAERSAEALHDRVRHMVTALREGAPTVLDVVDLVPGDVVRLQLGSVVPADIRLTETTGLQCDESVLTGESAAVGKSIEALPGPAALADLTCCALMGTVVSSGSGVGVVVATGGAAEFGKIALGLGTRMPETEFQRGLRNFSMLLMQVAGGLTAMIFVANVLLHRSLIDAVLFSLAIAVGITPQLLPAIVSTSLATGARRLARLRVLVKRLVCIEDLGDLDVLLTDKTGTLTEGRIRFVGVVPARPEDEDRVVTAGLLAADVDVRDGVAIGGNALDVALYNGVDDDAAAAMRGCRPLATLPFDHERQLTSALVDTPDGRRLVVKGAPEAVFARSAPVEPALASELDRLFRLGARVVAVATRAAPDEVGLRADDERDLQVLGLLHFQDPPKTRVGDSLATLHALGVTVKIVTGDNPLVAAHLAQEVGLPAGPVLTGVDIDALDEAGLSAAADAASIFARVSPEQKAQIVRSLRGRGRAIGFLGDGVNDALALHAADIGISVDTAVDVAKDAADIILLDKDLGVLAAGIREGRGIFANTIKYVLMGTSSNFGNMFSAAGASAVLPFLPMQPSQILLNNLLYDASQLTIPTDHLDEEQLRRPSHWDIALIRRFMMVFGPISSLFDFLTFAVMLGIFHAGPTLFRTGWFVESMATQILIVFAVRTHRVPFWRSRPSVALASAAIGTAVLAAVLPFLPVARPLGFTPLPLDFFAVLIGMVAVYLVLVELGKHWFYARAELTPRRPRDHSRRVARRASRFSVSSLGRRWRTAPAPHRAGPG